MQAEPTGTEGATAADLAQGWRNTGVRDGMVVLVHASLSSVGKVDGGAATVANSLRTAVGARGTLVVPSFTPHVCDPQPHSVGVPDDDVRISRDAVPLWHQGTRSGMGAIPEAVRAFPDAVRSEHPQASVSAVGAPASSIVREQPLGFATGPNSPFGRMRDLGAHVLLLGVGHNRNAFLHHVEALTPHPRLKLRRFPMRVHTERVWVEALDVANDNDTYFPILGSEFEDAAGIATTTVGQAVCRLIPVEQLVGFAVPRLTELLDKERRTSG